jgi:hypothetical protein
MDCVACGVVLAEPVYSVEDEECRYPLCRECDKSVDLRLMLMEAQAQGEIDMIAEMENVQCL